MNWVDRQLRKRGIRDERVIAAMTSIAREQFVPEAHRQSAYYDSPIDIGYGGTISQPYMTALMAESLELKGFEKVLDVGSGSGYHAAVLATLSARVISIEIVPELLEQARSNLSRAGLLHKVELVLGDGSAGYPEQMPYDAISVAAGAPDVPQPLLDQLADPGRMVIPIGGRTDQDLHVIEKRGGKLIRSMRSSCRFVPLRGEGGWR